ncbi:SDR family NAD(P)-dependent oxidoreductase [Acidisphaera sp. S103]|uniref:SDR family NAD(P)-dependent oxidoreductase n=1 Tax=Acidisphaera sp. S103 TaxID=1747223 RepID=UPI00352E52A9
MVTGASKGIGAEIARELAAEGASVVVNYAGSRDVAAKSWVKSTVTTPVMSTTVKQFHPACSPVVKVPSGFVGNAPERLFT